MIFPLQTILTKCNTPLAPGATHSNDTRNIGEPCTRKPCITSKCVQMAKWFRVNLLFVRQFLPWTTTALPTQLGSHFRGRVPGTALMTVPHGTELPPTLCWFACGCIVEPYRTYRFRQLPRKIFRSGSGFNLHLYFSPSLALALHSF